ncbi:hypothetical protein A2U01_0109959, partial [Trifolium medium]|nr:hypothetical protein [Trifolium medium]
VSSSSRSFSTLFFLGFRPSDDFGGGSAGDAVFRWVWWFGADPKVLCGLGIAVVRFDGVVVVAGGADVV